MFLAGQAVLENCLHAWGVAAHQGRRIEPEARKNLASIETGVVNGRANEFAVSQDEPIDLLIEHAPDDVFLHAIPAIDIKLGVEVVTGAARSHLSDELWRSFKVVISGDSRLAAVIRIDEEYGIRLWLVVEVQAHARVVGNNHARSRRFVDSQPSYEMGMGSAVSAARTGDGT